MGKKYYCDYCDKSLPDNVEGRKKHNYGLVHKKIKQAHYNMFMGKWRIKVNCGSNKKKKIILSI